MADDGYRNNEYPYGSNDRDRQDYGRDYGSGRDNSYSSAREYQAAGQLGGRDDRNFRGGGTGYGGGGYGGDRERYGADYGGRDYYGGQQQGSRGIDRNQSTDRNRFAEAGRRNDRDRGQRDYGNRPEGYDYQDRGFMARAGDEVRSWFGDDDAERRRDRDSREDERYARQQGGSHHDRDYHDWRRTQIESLDRDYDEYRRENANKFHNEFGSWRANRQTQRGSLEKVNEHMEVIGSDDAHVGTVDKVRGDRIILTKHDDGAGGRHHSIPSSWIVNVDDKVKIAKTADDARKHWRDEERTGALFGNEDSAGGQQDTAANNRDVNPNRSFSGTY